MSLYWYMGKEDADFVHIAPGFYDKDIYLKKMPTCETCDEYKIALGGWCSLHTFYPPANTPFACTCHPDLLTKKESK